MNEGHDSPQKSKREISLILLESIEQLKSSPGTKQPHR
jgi:hypothetical protein